MPDYQSEAELETNLVKRLTGLGWEEVVIPAGEEGSASVQIQALEPGTRGNQPPGAVNQISAPSGADLLVRNPLEIAGGTDLEVPAPTQEDREQLEKELRHSLQERALEQIQNQIEDDDILLSEYPEIKKMEQKAFRPGPGEPGDNLELTLRAVLSIWVVKEQDLLELGRKAVQARSISSQHQPLEDTLQVTNLSQPRSNSTSTASWRVQFRWREAPVLKPDHLRSLILGAAPAKARRILSEELALDTPPRIDLPPGWWFRLPLLPFRIQFQSN